MFYGFLNFILFYILFSNLKENYVIFMLLIFFLILEREESTYMLFKQHFLNDSSSFSFEYQITPIILSIRTMLCVLSCFSCVNSLRPCGL